MSTAEPVSVLGEDEFREIFDSARAKKIEWEKDYACSDFNVRHDFNWWVMKETEARLAALSHVQAPAQVVIGKYREIGEGIFWRDDIAPHVDEAMVERALDAICRIHSDTERAWMRRCLEAAIGARHD